ncbi:DUF2185 domain-containing protein [Oscillospiraceae bacterium 38-13]
MDRSQLHDFHPASPPAEGLCKDINVLLSRSRRKRRPCERDAFIALLAGVPALRKTPGLPGPGAADYFTTLPLCAAEGDAAACRVHLKSIFGITDRQSLLDFCDQHFHCHDQYLDFESVWEGRPLFDLAALTPAAAGFFAAARDFSAQFYPLLDHLGYLAWDISERMGHLRAGLACGLLTREEFDTLAEEQITQAQAFHSWEEYAASLVCGALYWDFRQGTPLPEIQKAQRMWMDLVRTLLANDAAWDSGFWYAPKREKEYQLWPSEMKMYLPDWEGPNGCFLTDRIAVDGCKVGWCYREEPEQGFPDSGWRFFSGDESEAYIAEISHTGVYDLNTVCNLDPEVIPLLDAPYRSAFVRGEDGKFRPEPFELTED